MHITTAEASMLAKTRAKQRWAKAAMIVMGAMSLLHLIMAAMIWKVEQELHARFSEMHNTIGPSLAWILIAGAFYMALVASIIGVNARRDRLLLMCVKRLEELGELREDSNISKC